MEITPIISVVITAYNGEKFIKEAVDSVLNQTFNDYEIIVVDDGSSDKTQSILKEYKNKIRYFYQNNAGTASARNCGIREAKGEYIAFLDQDDIYLPNKIEKCLDYFRLHKECGLVYSDMFVADQDGKAIYNWLTTKKYFSEGYIYENLLRECFFCPSAAVIRRDILVAVGGFDKEIRGTEDYDLWLRIARHHKIGLVKEPLVKWRSHDSNTSRNMLLMNENLIEVYKKQLLYKDLNKRCVRIIKGNVASIYYYVAGQYMLLKDTDKAVFNLKESLEYSFNIKTLLYLIDAKCFNLALFLVMKRLRGKLWTIMM